MPDAWEYPWYAAWDLGFHCIPLALVDPAFAKEVARKEFPDLPGDVVDKAIDAELKFLIPAQSVVTKQDQWQNLMDMQVYLGNAKGSVPFDQIIDNSFADKAVASDDWVPAAWREEP